MKKKILFVNASLTSGGSERVMTIIANEFCKQKYDVTMILVKPQKNENYYILPEIKKVKVNYKHNNKILKLVERVKIIRKLIMLM